MEKTLLGEISTQFNVQLVLLSFSLETCVVLWTNVTPINSIKNIAVLFMIYKVTYIGTISGLSILFLTICKIYWGVTKMKWFEIKLRRLNQIYHKNMTNPLLTSYSIVKSWKFFLYTSNIRNKTRMAILTTFFNVVSEALATTIRQKKKNKGK